MKIPFLSFDATNERIGPEMETAFKKVFDSKWYILGECVQQFEKEYAAFNKTNHCIGVSNGLDALHIALRVLGIGTGDEVIIPSNTFIASALAVSYTGAKPVFAEPNPYTYNIDPSKIAGVLTSKTKAVMPVHLYGQCCEMDAIMKICSDNDLYVVEDNAQAQGSSSNGKIAGSFGQINGTSFYPAKNLGALGDAGAITTDDADLAAKAAMLRNYGSEKKYIHESIGFNMRMDELQAAFLSVKLKQLANWTKERQEIASWYDKALQDTADLILPLTADDCTHVYHLYVIRTKKRNELQQYLNGKNIGTLIHYPVPPHLQRAYRELGFKKGDFPIAEDIADTCLSLPIYPGLSQSDVEFVAEQIKKFFKDA